MIMVRAVVLLFCVAMSAKAVGQTNQGSYTLYLPEFVSSTPKHGADTSYFYEYYDARSRKVSLDTVRDFSTIHFISMFKSYTDGEHTFVDKDGKEKPLPVSKIVYRYDRAGVNKWMTINYATNKTSILKEMPGEIVKTDSTTVTTNNTTQIRVNKYYKVETPKP